MKNTSIIPLKPPLQNVHKVSTECLLSSFSTRLWPQPKPAHCPKGGTRLLWLPRALLEASYERMKAPSHTAGENWGEEGGRALMGEEGRKAAMEEG